MPNYKIALPDGRVVKIAAEDPSSALALANGIPRDKSAAEKSTYTTELVKQRKALADQGKSYGDVGRRFEAATVAPFSPIMGEVTGLLAGAGNEAVNLKRRATGEPTVSSREIFNANRDATDEYFKERREEHPLLSLGGDIASAFTGGKLALEGAGVLGGLKPVVEATKAVKATKAGQATAKATKAAKAAVVARGGGKALEYGGKVAKGAGVGAAGGAAYGFAEGSNLEERGENAVKGGKVGALVGGGLEAAAPVAKRVGGALIDTARPVLDKFRKPGAADAAEASKAVQNALLMAKSKGMTADKLDEIAAADEGLDSTFAEALGSEGVNTQAALARRGGETGDRMRADIHARNQATPGGIAEDFETRLGFNPETAKDELEATIRGQRDAVGPEFEEARAGTHGVTSPEIERLLASKTGQKLLKAMRADASDLGGETSGLTMGRVEVPELAQGVHPNQAPPVGREILSEASEAPQLPLPEPVAVPRGPAEQPSRGPSALTFLRQSGHGISDEMAGEAKQAGLRLGARKGGADLNDMAIRLQEGGYTPRLLDEKEMETLLQSGQAGKLYAAEAEAGAQARYEARREAEGQQRVQESEHANAQSEADESFRGRQQKDVQDTEDWNTYTGEFADDPDAYRAMAPEGGAAPEGKASGIGAPKFEPAYQEALTPASLDNIRRASNDQVIWEFGRPKPGRKNKNRAKFAAMWKEALAGEGGALPALRKPLEESGDYLAKQDTLKRFNGKLTRGSLREFRNDWTKLKGEGHRDAARIALANDVAELWGKGALRGSKLTVRDVRDKLATAFDPDMADAFVARMNRRAELAASGSKMAPYSGSPTMTLQESSAAIDKAVEPELLKRVGGKLAEGRPLAALGDAAGSILMKALRYPATAGSSVAYRNELGRILGMDAKGAAEWLRELEKMPPKARRDYAVQLGLVGGSQAGAGIAGNREPAPVE